jgi:hypothetical protein
MRLYIKHTRSILNRINSASFQQLSLVQELILPTHFYTLLSSQPFLQAKCNSSFYSRRSSQQFLLFQLLRLEQVPVTSYLEERVVPTACWLAGRTTLLTMEETLLPTFQVLKANSSIAHRKSEQALVTFFPVLLVDSTPYCQAVPTISSTVLATLSRILRTQVVT